MVRGTFFGLEIGKTGLTTAQFGMDVTSHNIANLDTAGYTRQRIVSTAYDPFSTVGKFAPVGQGLVGGGVRVQILDQIRSAFLDRRFREESGTHAYWDTRAQSLSYIESFFDNVNEKTSINHSISEFFRSMTIISQDPVAGAPRKLMQTAAMDLAQQFRMIHQGLIDFQRVEDEAVRTKIDDINTISKALSEINVAIYTFEITGMLANDLRDKRNLLLDELSLLIDIEYREYPDKFGHSMMEVTVAGGVLVDHDRFNLLGFVFEENPLGPGEDEVAVPYWVDSDGSPIFGLDMSVIRGGQLKAHIDMRDGMGDGHDSRSKGVPHYIEMVNDLARSMVLEINKVHVQGWSDNPAGSRTGILFFNDFGLGEVRYYDSDGNWLNGPPYDPDFDPFDPNIASAEYFSYLDVPDDPMHPDFANRQAALEALRNITAQNFELSQDIIDNEYNIAASNSKIGVAGTGTPIELQRHNNENMKELYKLFGRTNFTLPGRNIGGFNEYATSIRFDVGTTLNTAKQTAETSRILTLAANNQRTAVAGVSLDEEMVGLVKFNHAYNGAARVITQMDDALDRLINGTGRVGL